MKPLNITPENSAETPFATLMSPHGSQQAAPRECALSTCLLSPFTLLLSSFPFFLLALFCEKQQQISPGLLILHLPCCSLSPSLCSQALLTQTLGVNAGTSTAQGAEGHLHPSGSKLGTARGHQAGADAATGPLAPLKFSCGQI